MFVIETCNDIKNDIDGILRKDIQKKIYKNQYSSHQFPPEKKSVERKLRQREIASQTRIPKVLRNFTIIRLKNNLHIPYDYYGDNKLGCLSIHPLSFNYKVIRTDKVNNLYTFTYQPIWREITPFEIFHSFLSQKNKQLAEMFKGYNDFWENSPQMRSVPEFDLKTLSTNKPLDCHFNIYTEDGVITTQRIVNQQYLDMIGVTKEMLEDYVKQTNFLPSSIYSHQKDNELENFTRLVRGWSQELPQPVEIINYQGQRFTVSQTYKCFRMQCERRNKSIEIGIWVFDCDPIWINTHAIEQNQEDYFGRPAKIPVLMPKQRDQSIINSTRPCGFKII